MSWGAVSHSPPVIVSGAGGGYPPVLIADSSPALCAKLRARAARIVSDSQERKLQSCQHCVRLSRFNCFKKPLLGQKRRETGRQRGKGDRETGRQRGRRDREEERQLDEQYIPVDFNGMYKAYRIEIC